MIRHGLGVLPEAKVAALPAALFAPDFAATAAHPGLVIPFAAAGVLLLASWTVARRRARERLRRLAGSRGARLRGPGREIVELLALAAILAALVGPAVGTREERVAARGRDVVLLFDTSASMRARDVPPSRLARARALADDLLGEPGAGDRVALAAFAGDAALLTPLTPDRSALRELLPGIDADLIAPQGSNLAEGLRVALTAFDPESARPRVVVLLSDGEDPEGRPPPVAALRRAGATLLAVGIGGDRPVPIPLGPGGAGVLRDDRGREVHSRRDTAALEALVAATGGRLLRVDRLGRLEGGGLRAAVGREPGQPPGEPESRRVPARRSAELAAVAFLLLLLEAASRGRRPKRASRAAVGVTAATLLIAAVPGRGSSGPARPVPGARALLEVGVGRARAGDIEEARRALAAAAVTAADPELAALAYYDLGVVALEAGDLEAARDAFLDALALDQGDLGARFNLEWTLEALARAVPPAGRRPGEGPAQLPGGGSREDDAEPANGVEPGPAPPGIAPRDPTGRRSSPPPDAGGAEGSGESTRSGRTGPTGPLAPDELERLLRQVREDPRAGLRALAGLPGEGAGAPETGRRRSRYPW